MAKKILKFPTLGEGSPPDDDGSPEVGTRSDFEHDDSVPRGGGQPPRGPPKRPFYTRNWFTIPLGIALGYGVLAGVAYWGNKAEEGLRTWLNDIPVVGWAVPMWGIEDSEVSDVEMVPSFIDREVSPYSSPTLYFEDPIRGTVCGELEIAQDGIYIRQWKPNTNDEPCETLPQENIEQFLDMRQPNDSLNLDTHVDLVTQNPGRMRTRRISTRKTETVYVRGSALQPDNSDYQIRFEDAVRFLGNSIPIQNRRADLETYLRKFDN